jgi:AcrR family transcriptional regulator
MAKTKPNFEKKICEAVLKLATRQAWGSLTLGQIAKATKIPVSQLKKLFADTNALLPALVDYISLQTASSVGTPDLSAAAHDRLFEVMMARFDVLQLHRKAILNIIAETKRNPSLVRHLLPAQSEAMQLMLSLAGFQSAGPKQSLAITGLLVIYGVVLWSWEKDESADMSKTMARLDRYLRFAEKGAKILFRTQ